MKILFVLNSGFDTPGPSNHLLEDIISKFLSIGDMVHVIAKNRGGKNPDIPTSILEEKNLTYDICRVPSIKKHSFIKRYLADIKYAFVCLGYYKNQKDADVVFVQSCNTALFQIVLLKLLLQKPIVFNVQDIFPLNASMIDLLNEDSLSYKLLDYFQKTAYKMSNKIITISDDMKNTLLKKNISGDKIDVIYNWSYSDEILEIPDIKNNFLISNKIADNSFKIVYAGNMGALQNIDTILASALLLKEKRGIRFYLIGDGLFRRKYVKLVNDMGLDNVIFYPMQSPQYAPHIYSMADINIIPLKKGIIQTALPSKTALCLSCGKPIIACIDKDSVFAGMIASCDKCSVIDCDDSQGLANLILEYYSEKPNGLSLGARELFTHHFSKRINVSMYIEKIKNLKTN